MKSLNLTPAESLIIISPRTQRREMIKITLIDLLLKRVLKINVVEHESKFLKRHYKSIIISEGELFESNLKPHEEILRDLILEYSQLELNEFARILNKKINSNDFRDKYVRDILVDKGYFKKKRKMLLSLIPHATYALTDKGVEVKSKIIALLDEAKYLEKWIKEDLGRAKAYLSVTGTHILLSNVYDIEDIKKFSKILSQIKPESKASDYYSYYLYAFPLEYLDDYDNIENFDLFDISVLDNFDSLNDFYIDFDAGSDDANNEGIVEERNKNST